MSERERAANPTTEEAIKYLEHMIFTQDFHPSTLRAKAVNTMAIEALREKQEREKGCEYCNSRFGIASHHINQAGLQAGTRRDAKYCPMCGKRLEVQP